MTMSERCTRCGELLDKPVWLELNWTTNLYSDKAVADHESQGMFPFGKACAKAVLMQQKGVSYENGQ
jgi:hypothetical protein